MADVGNADTNQHGDGGQPTDAQTVIAACLADGPAPSNWEAQCEAMATSIVDELWAAGHLASNDPGPGVAESAGAASPTDSDAVSGPWDELLAEADQWSPTDQWYGNRPHEAHRLIASLAAALRSQIAETKRLEQQNTGLGIRVQEGWARIEELIAELAEVRTGNSDLEQAYLKIGMLKAEVRLAEVAAEDWEKEAERLKVELDEVCAAVCEMASATDGNHASVPAGEVLWRGMTFQCQGCEAAGHSFISPNSLDVPPGTQVTVSRSEAATEEGDSGG